MDSMDIRDLMALGGILKICGELESRQTLGTPIRRELMRAHTALGLALGYGWATTVDQAAGLILTSSPTRIRSEL